LPWLLSLMGALCNARQATCHHLPNDQVPIPSIGIAATRSRCIRSTAFWRVWQWCWLFQVPCHHSPNPIMAFGSISDQVQHFQFKCRWCIAIAEDGAVSQSIHLFPIFSTQRMSCMAINTIVHCCQHFLMVTIYRVQCWHVPAVHVSRHRRSSSSSSS
jgi:hypothetical protein